MSPRESGEATVAAAVERLVVRRVCFFLRLLPGVSEMHRWAGVARAFPDGTD